MVATKYLVDTDWIIFYLRGKEPFVSELKKYQQKGLAISIITVAELYEGVFRSANPKEKEKALKNFIKGVIVLNITKPIVRLFGKKRADLRKKGITVGDFDLFIGCTALKYNLQLLSNNKKHYKYIIDEQNIVSLSF